MWRGLAILSLALASVGCRTPHRLPPCPPHDDCLLPIDEPPHELLLQGTDQFVDPGPPPPPLTASALTAAESAWRAARLCPAAYRLSAERQWLCERAVAGGRHAPQWSLQAELLGCRAAELRNDAAQQALALFHGLAESELQLALARQANEALDAMDAEADRVRAAGGGETIDRSEFARRRLEVRRQQETAERGKVDASTALRALIACPGAEPLFPVADLSLRPREWDHDLEVGTGLASRPDLRLLRVLRACLDETTLPVARGLLGAVDGVALSGDGVVCPDRAAELNLRRLQLDSLLRESEARAEVAIRTELTRIDETQRQLAIAHAEWQSWHERLSYLARQRDAGAATIFDELGGRLSAIQAESRLRSLAIELLRAESALRHRQGLATQDAP